MLESNSQEKIWLSLETCALTFKSEKNRSEAGVLFLMLWSLSVWFFDEGHGLLLYKAICVLVD